MDKPSSNFVELDIDNITNCIKLAVRQASNEEELKHGVLKCIEEHIIKPLGITQVGKLEYTLISGAKVDALYGHVIIEYKAPGKLSTQHYITEAKKQVIGYINTVSKMHAYDRYLGIIISDRIAFVRYDNRTDTWLLRGPYDITKESVIKLVEAIRGLQRKSLDSKHILEDFSPTKDVTINAVKIFYNKLKHALNNNPRIKVLYEDWSRLFRQATGYEPNKLKGLETIYGLHHNKDINYDLLLFSIHTYYSLIMKMIAAEIAYLYGMGRWLKSFISELDNAYTSSNLEAFKEELEMLENGSIFRNLLNITNFLEGNYFEWYLYTFDEEIASAIGKIVSILSNYELATPQLEPEFARDLLKRLYQNLVPRDIRHSLGEYYTPDWLAELILDEIRLNEEFFEELNKSKQDPFKPLELRVLDPACGSGTFLVMYINRLRRYAEEHYLLDALPRYILDNVVGYDLNPLAVLAAKTNYLLTIGDLLHNISGEVVIPIYLADSILIEKKGSLEGEIYILRTTVGEFKFPIDVVNNRSLLFRILNEMENCLNNRYTPDGFYERLKILKVSENSVLLLKGLYEEFLRLERENKDSIWISIVRNAFAPLINEKFDYIVGNPPWINWEHLPEKYRESTKPLWDHYKLLSIKGVGLGKVKKDLSMLFLVRVLNLYLKNDGRLGFLIPFTLLKTQAGAGFRRWLADNSIIECIHDLVTLYPFEGVINRTAAIIVRKTIDIDRARSMNKAIKHFIWVNPTKKAINTDATVGEVKKTTSYYEAIMTPLKENDFRSPWMQVSKEILEDVRKVIGKSEYNANEGVNTAFNQIYWVDIIDKIDDKHIIIKNSELSGSKKSVREVQGIVEKDLVYPLIRGRDVQRWYVELVNKYIIVPHHKDGKPFKESFIKVNYPRTYSYLNSFKQELENRSVHKLWGKGNPFYSLYGIGEYTFKPYKVVWKRIAGAITGKATSFAAAVVEPYNDKILGNKVVIADDSTIIVSTDDRDEAYYLTGILNSITVRLVIAMYTYELRQETHIVEFLYIPKWSPTDPIHRKISMISEKAHEVARKGDTTLLAKIEDELDNIVANLYNISTDKLLSIKRFYYMLSGMYVEEEEEETIELPEKPSVNILNAVIEPDKDSYIEVSVVNPTDKEFDIELDLPLKKERLRVKDGNYKISLSAMSEGTYKAKIRWYWNNEINEEEFTIEVKAQQIKRKRTLRLDNE